MGQFKFNYVPPQDLEIRRILKEGECMYKVKGVKTKLDRNANEMLVLTLKVRDAAGVVGIVDDYINSAYPERIHEFALSTGVPGIYSASGVIDFDKLVGLGGGCIVKTDKYIANDGNERESTKIAMYLVAENKPMTADNFPDDPIPF